MKFVSTVRSSTYTVGLTAIASGSGSSGAIPGQEYGLAECGECGKSAPATSIKLPVENGHPTVVEFEGLPPCAHWQGV